MQKEQVGFGLSEFIGSLAGAGLVLVSLLLIVWFQRRARADRNERPPQKAKLLRPAGYWLGRQIVEYGDRWTLEILQALAGGAVLGLMLNALYPLLSGWMFNRITFAQITSHPRSYLLLSVVALAISAIAWIIRSVTLALRLQRKIRNCRFGMRGEQAVAEALLEPALVCAGWTVFHDVPGEGAWNLDHVLVGPGGVVVIETKTRSRRKALRDQPEHEVRYDGTSLQFPWCIDQKTIPQARRNREWAQRFLEGFAPAGLTVEAIVVVPGWWVETVRHPEIQVMNAKYLVNTFLPSLKPRFTGDQLRGVKRRFEERCRDLEF